MLKKSLGFNPIIISVFLCGMTASCSRSEEQSPKTVGGIPPSRPAVDPHNESDENSTPPVESPPPGSAQSGTDFNELTVRLGVVEVFELLDNPQIVFQQGKVVQLSDLKLSEESATCYFRNNSNDKPTFYLSSWSCKDVHRFSDKGNSYISIFRSEEQMKKFSGFDYSLVCVKKGTQTILIEDLNQALGEYASVALPQVNN